jgi:hypothetical protein
MILFSIKVDKRIVFYLEEPYDNLRMLQYLRGDVALAQSVDSFIGRWRRAS